MDKIIIANWKMNGGQDLVNSAIKAFGSYNSDHEIVFCPPYTFLKEFALSNLKCGGQNLSHLDSKKGAFTGDISGSMLKELGCRYVIIGHSERRNYYGETNEVIAQKAKLALENQLTPIICVGESPEEYNAGSRFLVVEKQILAILRDMPTSSVIIAYEPIWAIGTGKIPSENEISDMHELIWQKISNLWGKDFLEKNLKIVYGGSVNENNAGIIAKLEFVHGLLVGGASLNLLDFRRIIESCN